jgi:hypothetical protein
MAEWRDAREDQKRVRLRPATQPAEPVDSVARQEFNLVGVAYLKVALISLVTAVITVVAFGQLVSHDSLSLKATAVAARQISLDIRKVQSDLKQVQSDVKQVQSDGKQVQSDLQRLEGEIQALNNRLKIDEDRLPAPAGPASPGLTPGQSRPSAPEPDRLHTPKKN